MSEMTELRSNIVFDRFRFAGVDFFEAVGTATFWEVVERAAATVLPADRFRGAADIVQKVNQYD